ncbi:MAG TPA: glycosyltransferase family 39 protein [Aldersonia sp.]
MTLARTAGALGLFGFLLGAAASWRPSFWYDEVATVSVAGRPLPALLRLLAVQDAVHGLYYLGMHLWLRAFGNSEFSARLPSALAVGVATAGVVVLAAWLADLRTGFYAGLLFAMLPRSTWAAVEARGFAASTACAVWLTVVLVVAMRRKGFRWWLGYGLAAVVSIAVFLPTALLVVAHGVTLLWWRASRSVLVAFAGASLGAALVSVPLVLFLRGQSGQVEWIPPLDRYAWRAVGEYQWFVGAPVFAVLFAVVLLAGAVVGRRRGDLVAFALPWALLPTVALVAYSLLREPYYLDRYLTFTTPAIALLGGGAVAALGRLRRWLPAAVLVVLALAATPNYLAQRGNWAKPSEMDFSDVADFVGGHARPGDCVAFAGEVSWNPTSARVALNADPAAFAGPRDVGLGRSAVVEGWLWDENVPPDAIADRLGGCDVLWFVADAERDLPRTIRHTSNEVWDLPPYHFVDSTDYAQLRAQGFAIDESWPLHMSQVVRLRR